MIKRIVEIRILLIFLLFILVYSIVSLRAKENPTKNYHGDFWNNIYNVDEEKLVAKIINPDIKLYYVKEDKDFGMYMDFILQISGRKKYFRWKNVNNTASYKPQLLLIDIDKDGKEEIIIQLCLGYGTGIFDGEVHVIRQDSFDEILVENPIIILNKEKIILREYTKYFEVELNDKKIILNKKGRLTLPYSNVGIGWWNNNTRYELKNNKLFARVPLAISVINTGEFVVRYKYQDKILQMESVEFLDYYSK